MSEKLNKKAFRNIKHIKIKSKPKIDSSIQNINIKIKMQKKVEFPSIYKKKDCDNELENIIQNETETYTKRTNIRVNTNLEMTNETQDLEEELKDAPAINANTQITNNQTAYAMMDNYANVNISNGYTGGGIYPKVVQRSEISNPTLNGKFSLNNPFNPNTDTMFKSSDRLFSNEYPERDTTRDYEPLDIQKTDRRRA